MKSKYVIFVCILYILPNSCSRSMIMGIYSGKSPHVFTFSKDSTFKYEYHDYCYKESSGTWYKESDFLYLNSFVKTEKFPLKYNKTKNDGQAFFKEMSKIIGDHDVNVKLTAGINMTEVVTGNYTTGKIDVADMMKFDENPLTSAKGKFGHEAAEQYMKQKNDFNDDPLSNGGVTSHKEGLRVENEINKNERVRPDRGSVRSSVYYKVNSNGKEYIIKYYINNGNIISIDPPKPVN